MKNLYESILGNIDDVMNTGEDSMCTSLLTDKNSDFWVLHDSAVYKSGRCSADYIKRNVPKPNTTFKKDDTLYIDVPFLDFAGSSKDQYWRGKTLKDFFPGVDKIEMPGSFMISWRDTGGIDFGHEIWCETVVCTNVTDLSDITFHIGRSNKVQFKSIKKYPKIAFCSNLNKPTRFHNVKIIGHDETIRNGSQYIEFRSPVLNNLSGLSSNATAISFHDTMMFYNENDCQLINSLFDWSWQCPVFDNTKKTLTKYPVKNIKKLVAVANNPKRYIPHDWVVRLNPGVRLSNVFDLSGFPDLEVIHIHSNNVEIQFVKEGSSGVSSMAYWASKPEWVQDRERNEILSGLRGDARLEKMGVPKTIDGWYVGIGKYE